ncbi:MAG: carboxypeptidase regulatory-like domain-containing protein, partial [Planctomycetota bacterium]|nr:carboxypeptidase regulatory-like domain-containing protein [Planctomycetota bacterium]
LIAAGVGGWLIFGGADAENDGDYGDSSVEDDGERAGPGLKGAAGGTKGVPRVPTDIRGRGMIQGVTRRGGEAVVETVELRQEIDPSNPFKGGAETQFIARLLDGGMSGKEVIARATTGEDGVFKFRGLAPGLYEIRATAEDGAMGFASASLPAAGARVEALVDIPEGDQVLKGRITYADGKAFRGTVLMAMGNAFAMMMGGTSKSMPAYTDEEGRFAIAGLSPGQYQVSALLPGVMRVMGAPIKVPFTGEYTLTINAAGKEVKGTVIDAETEEPVAGATIFGGGGNPESDFAIFTTKSDASGAFTMTLPVGRGGGMFVRADGYAGQTLDFNSSAPSDGLTVSLLRLAMLSGRVTAQEGGAAIAGITVFAMGGRGRGMMPTPRTAMTDADGRYTVEGVDPGAVKVWAVGASQVSVGMSGTVMGNTNTPYSAELEPGETGELDLETVAAGKVAGRVLTESGQAVPGAVVQAASGSGGPGMMASLLGLGASWGSAVTDAEGAYAIDVLVPGGKYKITAKAPDHPTATSSEFVAVGGKTEAVDVRMKAPRWIEVTVVDAAGGKPVAGAGILAVPEDGSPAVMMEMLGGGAMWTTTADGTVRVGPLPDGKHKTQVKAPGFIDHDETEVEAGATAPVRVELQRGLVLAGRLELPEGVPFQSVRVNVNRSGPDGWFSSRPPVQADGTWRVDTIEHEGEYKVSANGRWQERTFAGETTAETGDEAVVVKLLENTKAEGEALTVTVVDQDGKPVPAGRVELTAFRGDNGTSSSRTRLNGGQAQFRGFNAEGEIYVEVYELIGSKRGATIQGPVTFQDGKLEVRLGAPLSIQGLVTDQDGKAVPGVKVTAQAVHPRGKNGRGGQEHGSSTTGTDGRF